MTSLGSFLHVRLPALLGAVAAMLAAVLPARGADLAIGSPAPVFSALDDTGATWKSFDHVGKEIVVVYFYPADMTGG